MQKVVDLNRAASRARRRDRAAPRCQGAEVVYDPNDQPREVDISERLVEYMRAILKHDRMPVTKNPRTGPELGNNPERRRPNLRLVQIENEFTAEDLGHWHGSQLWETADECTPDLANASGVRTR